MFKFGNLSVVNENYIFDGVVLSEQEWKVLDGALREYNRIASGSLVPYQNESLFDELCREALKISKISPWYK